MSQYAVPAASFGIELGDVCKRKSIYRIKEIRPRIDISRCLRKAYVESSAAAAGHVSHHTIEDLSMGFIFIESVIEVGAKKPAALRNSKSNGAFDRALRHRKLGG